MRRLEEMGPLDRGRVLDDRYELVSLVGTGGMAEVWRARDRRLSRDVAVKVLSGPAARDASSRRRIEREARALAAADHPNIVAVFDYGEAPVHGTAVAPYIVMELVDGPDLAAYVAERGPLPVDEAQEIMTGVLGAVERAHAAGVVHGDLKPSNVFIGSHGPKVGDFGVARILGEETGTTTVAATPSFAAPEVLRGERASPASDVYSASCLAYELLAGRAPYGGANGWEVAQKHFDAPAPHVRKVRPDVPAALDEAIQRGMEKRPRKRFGSAAELASAFGSVAHMSADRTLPLSPAASPAVPAPASDRTEVITGSRPDAARAALFGPFAGWWDAIGRRRGSGTTQGRGPHKGRALAATLTVVVVLLVVGSVLLRDNGADPVAVPNVVGKKLADATALLRTRGFKLDDVSYRPVREGEAGRVVETIPAAKEMVDPGSDIHVIASAYAATPTPVVTSAPSDERPRRGKHKHHKD